MNYLWPPSEPIPWTFKTWIKNFKGVDLPIGDLAEDISKDTFFPDGDDFSDIHAYICERANDPAVIETFVLVWNFYQASK
ncbi:YozE family protein [Paenibacillus azoreducens]|uniref:YozE SAM-like domain-containing protein n=1 Tax=Paenibacillus azoreducens TaxID=116718 RepID=A0A920CQT7_9BACL|nr:YozE family protein [Paenibacillus azoreducens]GIO50231.1 hypothetical protein J34TS1_49960 [Paenibacillus azoreducens]